MTNITQAIIELISHSKFDLATYAKSHNRINNLGEALEEYVKDLFAKTLNEHSESMRNQKLAKVFSYLGNQNNPPDAIIRNGDALEIKKIENKDSPLALNSSYPKAKLLSTDPMITKACRDCENWEKKDLVYIVGVVKNNHLTALSIVYGRDYCADAEIYERIKNNIKFGVEGISGVEFSQTKELGRVNRVDPLGITYLRIRGMWGIENPFRVFDYLYQTEPADNFTLLALINNEKLCTDDYEQLNHLSKNISGLKVKEVGVKNPNNPAKLNSSTLITYSC